MRRIRDASVPYDAAALWMVELVRLVRPPDRLVVEGLR
jgi:hypothetical protein